MAYNTGKRTRQEWRDPVEAPANGARSCEWAGCGDEGLYRAPWSRDELQRYRWFCLEHVRTYNKSWNYYAGMDDYQVEADVRRDTVWQRPSWPLGSRHHGPGFRPGRISDGFGFFDDGPYPTPKRPATAEERAMATLDLTPPVTIVALKARYKQLVKLYHPDANGGDKAAEEKFKDISEAYRIVMGSLTS
jgi:hypothetical protein